jgi:hypothetical protein
MHEVVQAVNLVVQAVNSSKNRDTEGVQAVNLFYVSG